MARRHAATRRRANLGDPDQASGRAMAATLGCCGATVIESAASAWRQRLRQARWPTRGIRTARPNRLRFLLLNTVGKVLRVPARPPCAAPSRRPGPRRTAANPPLLQNPHLSRVWKEAAPLCSDPVVEDHTLDQILPVAIVEPPEVVQSPGQMRCRNGPEARLRAER